MGMDDKPFAHWKLEDMGRKGIKEDNCEWFYIDSVLHCGVVVLELDLLQHPIILHCNRCHKNVSFPFPKERRIHNANRIIFYHNIHNLVILETATRSQRLRILAILTLVCGSTRLSQ